MWSLFNYPQATNDDDFVSNLYDQIDKDRAFNFSQSHAAINSLSIENVEYRYLLVGGAESSIKIYDLNQQENNGASGQQSDGAVDQQEDNAAFVQYRNNRDLNQQEDNAGLDRHANNRALDQHTNHGDEPLKPLTQVPQEYGHKFGISTIQWWPFDNGLFVTSSFDGSVKVWDPNTLEVGDEAYSFDLGPKVYNIDISRVGDHSLIATALDHPFIRLLDLRTTGSSHTLASRGPGAPSRMLTVKWSPKHANILASGGSDGSVRLWDIRQSKACLTALDMHQTSDTPTTSKLEYRKAHRSSVNGLAWFDTGEFIISSGNDEKMRLWSLHHEGGKNMLVNYGPLIRNRFLQTLDPCLSASGDLGFPYVFFPSDSGEIFVFRAVDGKTVKRLNRGAGRNASRSTCMIARGNGTVQYFSGTMNGKLQAWSPQTAVIAEEELGDESDEEPRVLDDIWQALQGQTRRFELEKNTERYDVDG